MILKNSFENEPLIFQQKFISIDSQKYISEVEDLLKYFYKFNHTNNNRKLVSTIFSYFEFYIVFYYYQDSLFDVSIHLKDKRYSKYIDIIRKEEFTSLEGPLNSSKLSKTLEEGSQIKKIIFLNKDVDVFDYHPIHISFSTNTLTIDCSRIDKDDHLNYSKILLELSPGLILRLEYSEYWFRQKLDCIKRLLIYCKGSPLCCKLSFSNVVINIDIDKIRIEFFVVLNKIKHLYDSLSKIYHVELKNITYEELFINGSYFKKFIERRRDEYNNEKLKFEQHLKYSRIECYLDDFLNNTTDGLNQTISELKLKNFEFYADKIDMDRYDYEI